MIAGDGLTDRHEIKTVGIMGLGALGTMYGKFIADRLGAEQVYVIANSERIKRYRDGGVYYNGEPCRFTYIEPREQGLKLDLIIFAVKFHQLTAAMADARSFIGEDTAIISVLNGVISEGILAEEFGAQHVLYVVAQGMSAIKLDSNLICNDMGSLAIGDRHDSTTAAFQRFKRFLETIEMPHLVVPDIIKHQWGKLMLNVGCNQVTAVYDLDFAPIQVPGRYRDVMRSAMQEVLAVAEPEGVGLTLADLDYWFEVFDALPPDGTTSMRQDMIAGRKTEVGLFAGTIVDLGRKHNVPTPTNEMLLAEIRRLEKANGVI